MLESTTQNCWSETWSTLADWATHLFFFCVNWYHSEQHANCNHCNLRVWSLGKFPDGSRKWKISLRSSNRRKEYFDSNKDSASFFYFICCGRARVALLQYIMSSIYLYCNLQGFSFYRSILFAAVLLWKMSDGTLNIWIWGQLPCNSTLILRSSTKEVLPWHNRLKLSLYLLNNCRKRKNLNIKIEQND